MHHRHGKLARDLDKLVQGMNRRQMLGILGGATLLPLIVGCGGDSNSSGGTDASVQPGIDAGAISECGTIPQETGGPYPGDGTNGQNALSLSGIVRTDIRPSLNTSNVAAGIPLTVRLILVNTNAACDPLSGYAVYLWHCDRAGAYSMYSGSASGETYLRGVQAADASGEAAFVTIFPACYSGRWPHIHFEVYPSLASATNGANAVRTSQLALPKATADQVYATTGYEQSVTNLSQVSLASDNVFSDGTSLQVPAIVGNVTDGFEATLVVGIAA